MRAKSPWRRHHDFFCPDGFGRACRNPLCRSMYAMQDREAARSITDVYVVMLYDYEGGGPDSVWSTREAADRRVEALSKETLCGAQPHIEEMLVDDNDR